MAQGNLFMAHRCGFTQKVLVQTLRAAGFAGVVVMNRVKSFNLWAVACKFQRSREEMQALAGEHLPGQGRFL